MYAGRRIGAIVRVPEDAGALRPIVDSIPSFVDSIFIAGQNASPGILRLDQKISGDTRLEYIPGGQDDSPAVTMRAAYRRALEAGMEVIAVMNGDHGVNLPLILYIFNPVALGAADYAWIGRVQGAVSPYEAGDPSSEYVHYIQHCKLVCGNLQQLSSFQGYVVFSRPALQRLYEHLSTVGTAKVLAGIPCYNEEVSIGSVVLKAHRYVDEVLVIDDGSKDDTARVAKKAGATVIRHEKNQGKAAGVKTAIRYAREHPFDLLVLLDGDGQHKPEEIPALAKPILYGEADLVIGSRFLDGNNGSVPIYRRFGQTILTLLTNAASVQKTTDSQSGFRALNRTAMESLTVESDGYSIESDMISHLAEKGIRILETPITAIYDVPHKHKKNPFSHGYDIVAAIFGEIGYKRPMLLFGLTGAILLCASLFLGSYAFTISSDSGVMPFGFTVAFGILLFLGMLLIVAGLILNSLVVIMSRK